MSTRLQDAIPVGRDYYKKDLRPGQEFYCEGNRRRAKIHGFILKVNRSTFVYKAPYFDQWLEIKTHIAELEDGYIWADGMAHKFSLDVDTVYLQGVR